MTRHGKRLKSEKLEWGRIQAIYSLKVKSLTSLTFLFSHQLLGH